MTGNILGHISNTQGALQNANAAAANAIETQRQSANAQKDFVEGIGKIGAGVMAEKEGNADFELKLDEAATKHADDVVLQETMRRASAAGIDLKNKNTDHIMSLDLYNQVKKEEHAKAKNAFADEKRAIRNQGKFFDWQKTNGTQTSNAWADYNNLAQKDNLTPEESQRLESAKKHLRDSDNDSFSFQEKVARLNSFDGVDSGNIKDFEDYIKNYQGINGKGDLKAIALNMTKGSPKNKEIAMKYLNYLNKNKKK